MIMIPLPFVMAMAVLLVMLRELTLPSQRRFWLLAFLAVLAFQELLVGARFGYGLEALKLIQPISAAALPPLAYLSFARPKPGFGVLIHAVPMLAIIVVLVAFLDALDLVLAVNNLFYTAALVLIGLRGSDALAWSTVECTRAAVMMLWVVFSVLLMSGATDALIWYDFMRSRGDNIDNIVGVASVLGLMLGVILAIIAWIYLRQGKTAAPNPTQDGPVFTRLEALMQTEQLFMDPDISLSRIARRMGLPVRAVSRSINAQTGLNVSQYVNGLRIDEACRLLRDSDIKVTEVIYASGYNTKSNFNREFLRVTGKTPSAWRRDQA